MSHTRNSYKHRLGNLLHNVYYQHFIDVSENLTKEYQYQKKRRIHVSLKDKVLIDYYFATKDVNYYAMCVPYITKFTKHTIFWIRHICTISIGLNSNNSVYSHLGLIRKYKYREKMLVYRKTMHENEQFSWFVLMHFLVSLIAALTSWRHSLFRTKPAWLKNR